MNVANRGGRHQNGNQAYTLIELLCSVGIIVLVAAMLLPALRNGYAKGQRLYCINNLRQTGLAFHSFAHSHQDKFPMQVPVSEGGSLEYLKAANTMTGDFYFSYRHFQPLSNELAVPKVLGCPTDTRRPGTNFATLQNENLSYFVAGNPEMGNADSALAGNRNIAPTYGSIARVGGYRSLMWTEELHRFKGNVLFSDGHVQQLRDMFSITNSGIAGVASLHMPTVHPPTEAASGGGSTDHSVDNITPGTRGSRPNVCAVTNQVGTNLVVTWQTGGGLRKGALLLFPPSGGAGSDHGLAPPVDAEARQHLAAPIGSAAAVKRPEPPESGLKAAYHSVTAKGQELLRDAALVVYDIPWYLLLLLIVALLELRRRMRARHRRLSASSG